MESRRSTAPTENRARTKNLVVRLSDRERAMLDAVAEHEQMSASETFRWLVRRAYEQQGATAGAKAPKGKR